MSHRLSQSARHTNDLLEELERDKELEVLREYLTRFDLFPRSRDPASAPIRFEDLKELVKHWKLHRQRNFWKNHATKEDLVRTLYRHINTKIIPQEIRDDGGNSNSAMASSGNTNPMGSSAVGIGSPSSGMGGVPIAPSAPPRKLSQPGPIDSPRSRSILAGKRLSTKGPKSEHIFGVYGGDLFSQRGDYEDGMIYLSRFRKPASLQPSNSMEGDSESNQDPALEQDDVVQEKLLGASLDGGSALSREFRLKQECAFSLYYFTTDIGNERRMVGEGCMLALGRLSMFDDIEAKRFCAAAMLNLTWEPSLCVKMIEEGALLALLELAKAQHEEIRRNTSHALCRISYERVGQLRLLQEGCVSAIISMLNVPDSDTKEACVRALINVASHSGSAVAESVVQTILKISAKKEQASIAFSAEAICNLSLLSGPRAKVVEEGILDNICELSQSVSDSTVKINVATALCNFSGISSNLEALSQVRVLECLEDLLKFENELVREMCSVTIANISSHTASMKNLVLSDAVVQMVELGHRGNQVIQENTALSLSNMAATTDSRPLLSRFGVVSLLMHFLDEASALTKQHAIVALCSLVSNPSTCSELMQNNIPGVLARLTSTTQDRVRELSGNALFNLSCDKSLHTFLLKDDVIKAIVRLCKHHQVNTNGELEVEEEVIVSANDKTVVTLQRSQECAIGCCYNLSFFEESRKTLTRVDIVKTLFGIFQRPMKIEEMTRQCAGIIANLTFDVESRPRMVEDGCVRLIRKLMNSSNKETLLCCSIACCNLAADGLEKTPVLSMLIDLSASPHRMITLNCAIAFSKLASNAAYRPMLTKCAELYPALTLMMRCGIEDIQIYSAVTLCNLAIERTQRSRHIWKEGTVPDFIVNSLLRINSDSTKEICARALFNLLTHDEHRMAHIKEGVLYALVKLARLESVEIRSLCVTALYNLSCDPVMIDTLMEINVAQVITKMCEIEFSNQEIHRRLAACLTNIAVKPGTEIRLVESGALLAVLVLAEHNDPPTMRYCSAVLCYLSSHRSNCEAMAASNLIEVITKVIASDDDQQNVFGLNALCNISAVPTLHDRIEESGVIPQVLRLLSVSDQEDIALASTKILYNLTFHPKFRALLLQKDLINVFMVLFSRSPVSIAVVDVCVQIISILCQDQPSWGDLVRNGAVKVLRLIAPHCQSHSSIAHAVYALSQLSRAENLGQVVMNDGAMDIVAAATSSELHPTKVPTDLADRCAIILRSLSICDECLQPLVEEPRLIAIIQSVTVEKVNETFKNCILALYNITSLKSPSLSLLVSAGIVRLLIRLANEGGSDLAPLSAISLAHIKHIQKDQDPPVTPDGGELQDSMEDGIVATLLPMIDLDPASIQKFDRMAMALPANPSPPRPAEWVFLLGTTEMRMSAQLSVSWTFQDSAIDDARFVPAEPKTFLNLLSSIIPPTGVGIQDKLYGSFQIMKVRHEKFRIKRVDPRFLQTITIADPGSTSISELISAALVEDDMDRSVASRSESGDVAASDHGSDAGGEEIRSASPTKKKSAVKTMSRSGSNRNMNDPLFRRGSKSSHKGSAKGSVTQETKMSKRESHRKSHFGSTSSASSSVDSERGVVLPRI
ncbi:hypothetical protein Poli38472_013945 [Pythium oligandrum]|uniref:Vacuolar protein 8 n=1 Tax=Pythium oligandrum TaxID=41045 RepID=A0A8K1FDT0_PYTOL|nr:hypothetical protein Poli38472_013945 [Pythium oligandrum]|eukprot:TMW55183.1 hypothetical protein Poli38472_013945 [Pythium oligandrum]